MQTPKYLKEDILLAIQSLQYELNKAGEKRKPYIKEVAKFLNTYDDKIKFYINKFDLRDKLTILQKGYCIREINQRKGETIEEIKNELHELNENIKQQNKINEQHNENIKQLLTMIYAHITDYTVHVKDNEEGKYTDYNGVKIQNYTIKDVMKDIASGMYDIREK